MSHKFFVFIIFYLITTTFAAAQAPVIPPPVLRESNYLVSKRVWRIIDLEEKYNKVATWPKSNIVLIFYKHLMNGDLIAYSSDSLSRSIGIEKLSKKGNDTDFVETPIDPDDPSITKVDTVITPFDPAERITQLMLMEEWYFDEKHGVQKVQIVGIAPLYHEKVAGIDLGMQPYCWIAYYDRKSGQDARKLLVNYKVFNPGNDRSQLSYFDWFEQRRFHSFVIKESNANDISILNDPEVKRNGLLALIEAERKKSEQQAAESDLNEH
jgi:gliding motility associated protien GldN